MILHKPSGKQKIGEISTYKTDTIKERRKMLKANNAEKEKREAWGIFVISSEDAEILRQFMDINAVWLQMTGG